MTTLTAEVTELEAVAQEAKNVSETLDEVLDRVSRKWTPKHVNLELTDNQSHLAAGILDRAKVDEKGFKLTRKETYALAEESGLNKQIMESVETFFEDLAIATHAVSTDLALAEMKTNPEKASFKVRAEFGKNTVYTDTVNRFDSRTVSGGAGAERQLRETYGYHNPSIETDYKGMAANRQSVHALAKDLLG